MKKIKLFGIILVLVSFLFTINVRAENKNEVVLNFEDGVIHDGYVEYKNIAKLQLFKGDELVVDINNYMKIDLEEAEYKFVIEEIEDTRSVSSATIPVRLNINNWYYAISGLTLNSKGTFKLESNKFKETLNIKLERKLTAINTKVENVFNYLNVVETIDLKKGYVIDFTKNDDLTQVLKLFADIDKTLYYKNENGKLLETKNEGEAIIKIVGNKSENNAVITALNVGNKKEEKLKGVKVKYTGSSLKFEGSIEGVLDETRYDYYTTSDYDFTFKYPDEKNIVEEISYKFLEGENLNYTIDKDNNARFRIDADYSLFQNGGKVYIDNVLVDSNNYTSESGSTIINLKKDYLNKLSIGEHKLKVLFNNGGVAESKFTINKTKEEIEIKKEETTKIENPKTVDNIVTYFVLSIVSLVGITYLKKTYN